MPTVVSTEVYGLRRCVVLSLDSGPLGRGSQPATGGAAQVPTGFLPVTGEGWGAWLLAAARPEAARASPPEAWTALTWLARREGYTVTRAPGGPAASETTWESRHIKVRGDLPEREAIRALLHELGHVLADGDRFHPPGATTAGCRGQHKLIADSVAFLAATRLGLGEPAYAWPRVTSWAGKDVRARPEDIIHAATARIIRAAARIIAHLDIAVFGIPPHPAATARLDSQARPSHAPPVPDHISRVLQDAERFYLAQLRRSWAPRYLASRGLGREAAARWRVGYAPAGWTTLLSHLRSQGHDDAAIQAAGLARLSSRGTLIDHFRDRVMLAIRDEHGQITGFIGRARPGARPRTPKYLNSPESSVFKKSDVLFGLYEARTPLRQGACPVLVEGPFDAIAVSTASADRLAGVAPCGTAFTPHQADAIAGNADLGHAGIIVALDGDHAGQKGAVKAYEILRQHTGKTSAVMLPPDRDPAEIFQSDGPAALAAALQHSEPLASVVIDACIDQWADRLDHPEGQFGVLHNAAARIAHFLPPEMHEAILSITAGQALSTLDENLRPIANPELEAIARILPADAICQIARTAERASFEHFEVTAAVANAVARDNQIPKDARDGGTGFHVEADPARAQIQVAAADFIPNTVFAARPEPSGFRTTWRQRHPATKHNDGVSRT